MSLIGYARVSTTDQGLDIQLEQLQAAGCEKIFSERISATSTQHREELAKMLDYVREADVLLVTRLDRLARSMGDLIRILDTLNTKGVGFRCIHQGLDTTSAEGRLMIQILGAFAEFENGIRRERMMEGVRKAQAEGRYKGTQTRITREMVTPLKEQGLGASAIARELKCDPKTVYRAHPEGWGPRPAQKKKEKERPVARDKHADWRSWIAPKGRAAGSSPGTGG